MARPDRRAAAQHRGNDYSLVRDMPRLAGAALLWCFLDTVRAKRPARPVIRRLGAG